MRDYTFEYINQRSLLILFGISLAVFIALIACISYLIPITGKNGTFILLLGGPAAMFWFNRGKLKKQCTAHLSDSSVNFDFEDRVENVEFKELLSYKVEHYNGTTLVMKFRERKKIKLVANGNFCDSAPWNHFVRLWKMRSREVT